MKDTDIMCWVVTPWKAYPIRLWRSKHADYTTDAAFVLAKIGSDAKKIVEDGVHETS